MEIIQHNLPSGDKSTTDPVVRPASPYSPIGAILPRLDSVKNLGNGKYLARCPAHSDGRPSLSLREDRSGKVLAHCFAECETADIVAAIGLTLVDLYPPSTPKERQQGRRRANSKRALDEISAEVTVVQVIASDLKSRKSIDRETWDRLAAAAKRIRAAQERLP